MRSRSKFDNLILTFVFIHCKTVKVSQDSEVKFQNLPEIFKLTNFEVCLHSL